MLSFLAKPWLFSIALAFALLAPERAAADDRFGRHRPVDRIVVFGTSLSDPGNAFQLRVVNNLEPFNVEAPGYGMTGLDALMVIPSAPYAIGGNRFSNGLTWIEQLARPIGLGWSVRPAMVQSVNGSSNYAVGGARASDFSPAPNVPLSQQVDAFLRDFGRYPPRNALYVIEIGGNDIRDALNAVLMQEDPEPVIGAALQSVGQALGRLYHKAGARKFLVWNTPDLGRTPAVQRLDAFLFPGTPGIITGAATDLSKGYNAGLSGLLGFLSTAPADAGGLPGIDFVHFDAFAELGNIQGPPPRYGLRDASTPCINPISAPSQCAQPDRYLFWDGIHPTRAGHVIIAFLVGKALVAEALEH